MKKNKIKEINRKLVVVGDGYCGMINCFPFFLIISINFINLFLQLGKSTLIAAFYNRKFIDKYEPTIFDTFSISTEIYKKHVNLEICDSAGSY